MTAKNVHRLSIVLLVITSVFFGFVLASLFLDHGPRRAGAVPVGYPLAGPSLTESDGSMPALSFRQVADLVIPSVVNIYSLETGGAASSSGQEGPPKGGSGIILDTRGYILTNWHVVEDTDKVIVTLHDSTRYDAEVVGGDALTDLALLRIKPRGELRAAVLGSSADVRAGDWAIAIGHPSGLAHTVTVGVVSAVERSLTNNPAYWNYIQTDAAINPGNSGGPLLNARGEVIGINTMIFQGRQNLGFSIPIDLAKTIIEQLRKEGRVRRGYLGLQPGQVTEDIQEAMGLPDSRGAIVSSVVRRLDNGSGQVSPAYKAGIRPGDIIISFDGEEIDTVDQLYIKAAYTSPGTTVPLKVRRDGRVVGMEVTLTSRPSEQLVNLPGRRRDGGNGPAGIRVRGLAFGVKERLVQTSDGMVGGGVTVASLDYSSDAYNKGIRAGDIIARVGSRQINTVEDFESAIRQALSDAEAALLYVGKIDSGTIAWRFVAVRGKT